MFFPPFARLIPTILDEDWRARNANHDRPCLACYKTTLASIIEFSSCVLAPRQKKRGATNSSVYNPRHNSRSRYQGTHTLWTQSPFAYLEPTETVAQAPRFARHLIDKRRHPLGLTTRKMRLYPWYIRHMEVLESTAPRPRVELRCSQDAKSRPLAAPRANTRAATREPARGTYRTCHDLDFDAGGVIPDAYFGRHGAPAGLRPVGPIELLYQPLSPKAPRPRPSDFDRAVCDRQAG
jgi:hypothetical protein